MSDPTRPQFKRTLPAPRPVSISDITESLREIDASTPPEKVVAHKRKHAKAHSPAQRRKWRKLIIWLIILIILGAIGYFAYRIIVPALKLTHGNLLSLVEPGTPLATDGNGHTNILIFGTSQDDTAHQDASGGGGMWLTDSIMVASLNQTTHTITMISIPRDLWTSMPNGCDVGYEAKINAVYECGANLLNSNDSAQNSSTYASQDQQGAQALESTAQTVTGLTMQYYVHVNYKVLQQAVDAIGGIQVNIVGDGADGIYDTNFDWDCPNGPYTCKNVYYPHDGTYTLNGTQALNLARARGDYGTYSYKDFGLDRGDFDREANQQKIIAAIKAKATSTGTLMNPVALSGLFDALGSNITTDLQGGNYKTLIDFVKKIPSSGGMRSVNLGGASGDQSLVTGQEISGQSVEVPVAGTYDYSAIIAYIARQLSSNPAVAENATIAIYNASDTSGVAAALQTKLAAGGLTVTSIGDAASSDAGSTQYTIYDTTNGQKPQTIKYLQSQLAGSTVLTTAVLSDITSNADIIIVIGAAN